MHEKRRSPISRERTNVARSRAITTGGGSRMKREIESVGLIVVLLGVGCAPHRASAPVSSATADDVVPPVAPDTRPAWFDDDSSWAGEGAFCALKRVVTI